MFLSPVNRRFIFTRNKYYITFTRFLSMKKVRTKTVEQKRIL